MATVHIEKPSLRRRRIRLPKFPPGPIWAALTLVAILPEEALIRAVAALIVIVVAYGAGVRDGRLDAAASLLADDGAARRPPRG